MYIEINAVQFSSNHTSHKLSFDTRFTTFWCSRKFVMFIFSDRKKGKAVVFELWISERIWQDQGQKVKLRFKSFLSKRIFRNLLILFFMSWGKVLHRGNKCYHNVVSELNRFAGATIQDKFYLASATITLLLVMLLNIIIMLMFDCVPWLISDKQKLILKKVSFESIEWCFK